MAQCDVEYGVTTVVLNLDPDEAVFLRDLLANVSGDPKTTRRKYEVSISKALDDAGILYEMDDDLDGNIECR
jgi:hypothetical protein